MSVSANELANMELRHLTISQTSQLSQILDRNDSWKSLMEKIPRNLNEIDVQSDLEKISRKYSAENIQLVDETSKQLHRSPTLILLDEWGTSGKKRATVGDLLNLLVKVQLYRAADFVAMDILKGPPPKRPDTGPVARIDINLPPEEFDIEAMEEYLKNAAYPNTTRLFQNHESEINNMNRDYSNSVSVDHVKQIREFFASSSDAYTDQSESDSHSDLIEFSATVNGGSSVKNHQQQSSQLSTPVFPPMQPSSIDTSEFHSNNNDDDDDDDENESSVTESEWNANNSIPNLPNISAIQSISSHLYSNNSISSQVNNSIIPDIDKLQLRDELNSASVSNVSKNEETVSTELSTESYIPKLSLLHGNS
ncbi:protein Tube [Contarinia nasturtii]|uniref:protein Tube n=1 Tax=Contarinia nasturtii TaxID=265458 RepID=UPI0012D42D10|nr:protein Tube [Contarinia nasturtii]